MQRHLGRWRAEHGAYGNCGRYEERFPLSCQMFSPSDSDDPFPFPRLAYVSYLQCYPQRNPKPSGNGRGLFPATVLDLTRLRVYLYCACSAISDIASF